MARDFPSGKFPQFQKTFFLSFYLFQNWCDLLLLEIFLGISHPWSKTSTIAQFHHNLDPSKKIYIKRASIAHWKIQFGTEINGGMDFSSLFEKKSTYPQSSVSSCSLNEIISQKLNDIFANGSLFHDLNFSPQFVYFLVSFFNRKNFDGNIILTCKKKKSMKGFFLVRISLSNQLKCIKLKFETITISTVWL